MAYWEKVDYKLSPGDIVRMGDGENIGVPALEIKPSEGSYSRNCSSRAYPSLSTRPGKAKSFGTGTAVIATPLGLSAYNNTYPHIVDGNTWKSWTGAAWANISTPIATTQAKFVEFNTAAVRYLVMFNGTQKSTWNGAALAQIADVNCPATNLLCTDDYRLHALKGSVWSCSAAGSVTDWTTAADADSGPIAGMIGVGTAICAHNDMVFCWSDQTMHVLLGNDPEDYSFSLPISTGCISNRSVISNEGTLYYLDYERFNMLNGLTPVEVSQKVKPYLQGIATTYKSLCCTGSIGKYIYLSIPYGAVTNNNLTLEYDTEYGTWYPIDIGFLDFVNIGEFLYGVDTAGIIWKINSGTADGSTAISWSHITGCLTDGTIANKKTLSKEWLLIDLPAASTLTISYSTTIDGNDFVDVGYTFTGSATEQTIAVDMPTSILQSVPFYRLKFAGTGPCTIYFIQPELRIIGR